MTEETTETVETVENDVQSHVFADFYPVNPPFGFVGIEREESTGKLKYLVVEPTLTDFEEEILEELKETLIERMDIPLTVLRSKEQM